MNIERQSGGLLVSIDGDELASAVTGYLERAGLVVHGPRTVRVDGGEGFGRPRAAHVFVDPSGHVRLVQHGVEWRLDPGSLAEARPGP